MVREAMMSYRRRKKVLGTTHRGRTKITSQNEINYLEANKKPYTRITKQGRRVRRNVR